MSSARIRRGVSVPVVAAVLATVGALVAAVLTAPSAGADDPGHASARRGPALSGYDQVSAGGEYTCGIIGGALFCWGRNTWGQTGIGERTESVDEPHRVGDSTSWKHVAAGGATTCGIRGDARKLYCWGLNNRGQVGDGTREVRLTPYRVAGTGWRTMDVGWYHACGIKGDAGKLYCWGDNQYGELGQGNTRQSLAKHRVPGHWLSVRTEGWTTCGIRTDHSLWCWGRNLLGQVGDGTWADRTRPTRIGGKTAWSQVELSWTSTCGRRRDGSVWCWGRNDRGGLGDGTTDARNQPTAVRGQHDARRISVFEGGACLLDMQDHTWCWGDNRYGQVGGDAKTVMTPRQRVGSYRDLSSGWLHTCGLGSAVVCWGSNERSQLGRAATAPRTRFHARPQPGRRGVDLTLRIGQMNALGEHHTGPYRDADRFAPSRLRSEWEIQAMLNQHIDVLATQEASGGQIQAMLTAGQGRFAAFPDPSRDRFSTESTLIWDKTKFAAVRKRVIRTMFITHKLPRPYVELRDRVTGREFWVMGIHNAGWDMQRQRNVAVADQIAKLKELQATGLPVFYLGDFNERKTVFCKVVKQTSLRSASGGRLAKDGTCVPPRTMRVDWIFGPKDATWTGFNFNRAPMVALTTDHHLAVSSVRVP